MKRMISLVISIAIMLMVTCNAGLPAPSVYNVDRQPLFKDSCVPVDYSAMPNGFLAWQPF